MDTSDPDVGALRLVDEDHSDGGGSQDPSGEPSGSPSQSGEPGGGEDPDESDPADDEGSEGGSKAESDSAGWVPIAVQAGASLGLVGLAAVALIPGRRPPERVRAR
ncbi:MAG: hypothetical protein ACRDXX_21290 [Stackebrandtia sp.]